MVQEVEALRPELKRLPFHDVEGLEERHIHLDERRSEDLVTPDGTKLSALRTLPGAVNLAVGRERNAGGLEPAELAGVADAIVADQVGTAPTRVTVRIAVTVTRGERLTAHPVISAVDLPATKQELGSLRATGQELAALTNRNLIERADKDDVRPVVIRDAAGQLRVARIVSSVVVDVLRERVVRHHGETAFKALVEPHLERVVVIRSIAAVVTQVLRPTEFLEERLPLIRGQRAEAIDVGLVGVIIAANAGEDARAFGADIGRFHRHAAAQLALDGKVPRVDRGEANRIGDHKGRHPIRQQAIAIGTQRLVGQNLRGVERRRAAGEGEDAIEIIGRLVRLNTQHRKVLRYVVAKDRTEDAQVITAAVAGADDGLLIELVSNAQPGSEVGERRSDVQVKPDAVLAGHHDLTRGGVQEATLTIA